MNLPEYRRTNVLDTCKAFNDWLFTNRILSPELKNVPILFINRLNTYLIGDNEEKPGDEQIGSFSSRGHEEYSDFIRSFETRYLNFFCDLTEKRKVFTLRPLPEMEEDVPTYISRNLMLNPKVSDMKISLEKYHKLTSDSWSIQDKTANACNIEILNPLPYLCDENYCYGSKEGMPLYFDDDHLSETGNKLLVPMFEEIFKDLDK